MRLKVGEMFKFTLLLYILGFSLCTSRKLFAGPYDIEVKKWYFCNDVGENSILFSTMKFVQINKTHVNYSTNVTVPHGFHDNMVVMVEVSIGINSGWKRNFINVRLDHPCSDNVKIMPGFFKSILEAAGKNFTGCPIPAGEYYVKDWKFHMDFTMKTLQYNKYKATITVLEKGKIQTCLIVEVLVVPKRE